jgi:membrane fusion protein, copper/silver efflux system
MKRNWKSKIIGLLFSMLLLASCRHKDAETAHTNHEAVEYTCPMHPQIIRSEPGTCPICGMELVKKSDTHNNEINHGVDNIVKATNSVSVSSVKTVTPVKKSGTIDLIANGIITYDTRKAYTVPVRFGGRVEKLFIKYNFQPVTKGQKILEIYSPEIVSAQRELLFLLNDDRGNTGLIESSKQKLRLLGMSELQFQNLTKSKKETYALAVFSPYSGYIVEEPVIAQLKRTENPVTPSGSMNGMSDANSSSSAAAVFPPTASALSVREGQYLNAGQGLFKIVNTERLWAEFDFPQSMTKFLRRDQLIEIKLNASNSETIRAKIYQLIPFFSNGESFTKVRVELNNPDRRIKVGTLATGRLTKSIENATWIPASSTVDLGNESVVFVKKGDAFQAKKVITGTKSGEFIEVIDGIGERDEIAADGQFMIDSESFIKITD